MSQNKLPTSKAAIRKVEMLAARYILLDSIKITPEKELEVLAVPESCTDKIITPYHSNLFAGHQGAGCHKNIFNYYQQIFHSKSNTLS